MTSAIDMQNTRNGVIWREQLLTSGHFGSSFHFVNQFPRPACAYKWSPGFDKIRRRTGYERGNQAWYSTEYHAPGKRLKVQVVRGIVFAEILYLTMSLSNQRTKFVPHDHGIFQRIL
jgi:hypothetical protein